MERKRPRPGLGEGRGAHRPVLERLQDLRPQLCVALVLLDEVALLGGEAVGLHLGLLGCPSRGPVASWDRAGRVRVEAPPPPRTRGWVPSMRTAAETPTSRLAFPLALPGGREALLPVLLLLQGCPLAVFLLLLPPGQGLQVAFRVLRGGEDRTVTPPRSPAGPQRQTLCSLGLSSEASTNLTLEQ